MIYKYGWHALMIAAVGDLLISFILSLFYRGYNSLTMSISALGSPESPVRIPFNIWMLLEGVLFLLSLPALHRRFADISRTAAGLMLVFIAVFAVGACILTCFFSVNSSKEVVTTASRIHGIGSAVGLMLMLFVPLILAILSFRGGDSATGVIGIISFAAALITFTLFVMSDKPHFAETPISYEGLWQRLSLVFMYLPLVITAIKNIK